MSAAANNEVLYVERVGHNASDKAATASQAATVPRVATAATHEFSRDVLTMVRNFHRTFPQYQVTPLLQLPGLAAELGVGGIWIKDESKRFDLNSFKVLGGAYAVARYLGNELGIAPEELSFARLNAPEARAKLGTVNFVTATDGNHGRAVAWSARELGHRAVVFMPKGSSPHRVAAIEKEGAEVHVTDGNYDETIRVARAYMEKHGGVIVQDTSWEGYRDIPLWIMQGYAVVLDEVADQLEAAGVEHPDVAFLQAGVGSFAGGAAAAIAERYGAKRPRVAVVEPAAAACYYESVRISDGQPHDIGGELDSIMAGLACGEPNRLAWPILRDHADLYFAVTDPVSASAMRLLAQPRKGDEALVAGESAAAGLGIVAALSHARQSGDAGAEAAWQALGLGQEAQVLIVSTEGDTDPDHYHRIITEGLYPAGWERRSGAEGSTERS